MTLRRLRVTDFRCLRFADVEFDSQFTLISGPNASGKTSLLEALYVLGRGRSFRTRRLESAIRSGMLKFTVFGEVDRGGPTVALGVEGSAAGVRAKIAGDPVPSLAELAAVLPAQIIDPEVHRLIEEGPSQRRRFLDWGVFHVEHSFILVWRDYHRVLRQRNAALRGRMAKTAITAWDHELIELGQRVSDARSDYLAALMVPAAAIASRLLGLELTLSYRTGWRQDQSLASAVAASFVRDVEAGVTLVGPQRADMSIKLDGEPARDRVSRGQQKLLAAALLIAQVSRFPAEAGCRPILLLDDPAAELDGERLVDFIREVASQSVQLVVTSLNANFSAFGIPGRRYVVRSGSIELA